MLKHQKSKKFLSLVMSVFMIMGCFAPNVLSQNKAYALQNKEIVTQARVDLAGNAMSKIEAQVMEEFEKEDLVEVMVYMNSQVDTEMVAYESQKALSATMTPYQTKLQVRRDVVEALRDNAETTQANIVNYLNSEKEKGNVADFQTYTIVNMLYVKATRDVVENLAYMTGVGKIYKNKTHTLDLIRTEEDDVELASEDIQWNITNIRANEVWDLGYDGTGVVVGIMDTGVDWTHLALKNKWRGYNPISGETTSDGNWYDPVHMNEFPEDIDGHGTHVTGTIVGQEPDGSNKVGVAPGAKWIAARIFAGSGYTTDDILLAAADWMIQPGGNPDNAPDVINNSWGGGLGINDWYRDAVRAWRSAGIVPIFAAGNQQEGEPAPWPGSISIPANYPESIAIAAVDRNNQLASFSKLGPSPYDETLIKPNLSAGGVNVRSSMPYGEYGLNSGTSMSAPAVSGVVALLLSTNVSLGVDEVQDIIQNTAMPLTDNKYPTAPNMAYGYGIVDAYEAVLSAVSGTGFITGRVLVPGEDTAEANIEHEQQIFETYMGSDIEVVARITDDISVTEAEVLVKQQGKSYWMIAPMTRISGDHKDGIYKGIINVDMIAGDQVTYKIKVRDYAGDVVVSQDFNISVKFGVVHDEYTQGFEENVDGWILGGAWEHGIPANVGPQAYEGEKVVATKIDDYYPGKSDNWLIAPPLDLRDTSLESASLRYHEWYDIEEIFDNGYVLISDDLGSNWIQVRPNIIGEQLEWKEVIINLDDYIGSENPVLIAFKLESKFTDHGRIGWYIDNVRFLGKDDNAPEAPTGLNTTPSVKGIKLSWNKSPEADLSHYNIYRMEVSVDEFEKIADVNTNMFVDENTFPGTTYFYKIKAVDYSGNESEFSEEIYAVTPNFTTIFESDFEENNGGFISGGENNCWQWGYPKTGPMGATSGEKVWGTNLEGDYSSSSECHITSEPIIIPENGVTILTFNHWAEMDYNERLGIFYDTGEVQISADGGNSWVNITPTLEGIYYSTDYTWINEEISLSDYAGQTVQIRFYFYSDVIIEYEGWYIDDVYILNEASKEPIREPEKVEIFKKQKLAIKKDYVETSADNYIAGAKADSHITIEEKLLTYNTISDYEVQSMPMVYSGIPAADAVLTIAQTGRSVKINPLTGKFSIQVPMGTYTLIAEAYGYFTMEQTVEVLEDEAARVNFVLEQKPQGTITGQIFDRYYGTPAAYAVIRLVEDPRVAPVIADENGNFVIENVYIGEYTLKVIAEGFEPGQANVTVVGDETANVNISLKRFVGSEDEITYDDGTAESAIILNLAGNGAAVRFTPDQYGKVKGANIYFYDSSFPTPGGNRIGFAVYGVDEKGQAYQVGETIFQDIVRGDWNFIDLSSLGFATGEDFYISTIQSEIGDQSPAVGIDRGLGEEYADRSYMNIEGKFMFISEVDVSGGLMIRARMEYWMSIPTITNFADLNYVNQDQVTVEGLLTINGIANIYVNGDKVASVESVNKVFSAQVDLPQQENTIKVTAQIGNLETEPSEEIVVIKDMEAPELTVVNPVDNAKVNAESVRVTGTVNDNIQVVKLEINDNEIELSEDGSFDKRVILNIGENLIIVKATDLAGNITVVERTVIAELETPDIANILPAENVTLRQGETLTVSFNAASGGQGYFKILMPFGLQDNSIGIPMTEENGLYTGTWTVPEGLVGTGLNVQVIYVNQFGTRVSKIADGKITVIGNIVDLSANSIIIGVEAFDIEYLNNSAYAQAQFIEWISNGGEVYIKINETDIVTEDGQQVSIEALPDFLTHFDANGEITYYEK